MEIAELFLKYHAKLAAMAEPALWRQEKRVIKDLLKFQATNKTSPETSPTKLTSYFSHFLPWKRHKQPSTFSKWLIPFGHHK
jgi:hypothetical protein